jgi:tetratricopeptide (TPR) repeat protein
MHTAGQSHVLARWALLSGATLCLAACLSMAPAPALADGGGGGGGGDEARTAPLRPEDPQYTAAVKAIKAGDFATAIRLLEGVVAREPTNADAFNWLGYATRRAGDAAKALPIYEKALAINPKHRGAHEYLGEAYLQLGNLPKAKEYLARLDSLCFFPCSEFKDLKKAIQSYEANGGHVRPASR